MDFKNAKELLALCDSLGLTISEVMKRRESDLSEVSTDSVMERMRKSWDIMKDSAKMRITDPVPSVGGLIGGEAKKLSDYEKTGRSPVGGVFGKSMTYALSVMETNASMGLVTAAPTAGSSGVIPGILLALQEEKGYTDDQIVQVLFNAGAIGYLAMRNATVSGAVGGCQAEIGVASAMAASAATELLGGTVRQCTDAASTVLMNMLGLVCDPVGGLVEYPCQKRNAAGVANALAAAELALAGIEQLISLDEMIDTMYRVGRRIPYELRETALEGCAAAPSACAACRSD